jgi:hypothetical protein
VIKISDIEKFLNDYPAAKSKNSFLHKQPVILLLYYLIKNDRAKLKDLWPLTDYEIKPLFTELGVAFSTSD